MMAECVPEVGDFKKAFEALSNAQDGVLYAKDPLLIHTKGAPPGFSKVTLGGYDIQSTFGFVGSRRPTKRGVLEYDCFMGLYEVTQLEYFNWYKTLDRTAQARHLPKDRDGKALWNTSETSGIEEPEKERLNHPVVGVDLISAMAYALFRGARIPTELEWCAMAGGPQSLTYPYGKEFKSELCNGGPAGKKDTMPVGSYPDGRGPFGNYDVSGNVAEWTASYEDGKPVDPAMVSREWSIVVRGGSFTESENDLSNGWVWLRQGHQDRDINTGFRLAMTAPNK
jgi:formylglycine-generating enzyme required for sulfatase activity